MLNEAPAVAEHFPNDLRRKAMKADTRRFPIRYKRVADEAISQIKKSPSDKSELM
jgi:hypothetical protein